MATPLTLKESKFSRLMEKYSESTDILPVPCPGLVEIIESGIWTGSKIQEYIQNIFKGKDDISSVVLGCTHYIFIKEEIQEFFGDNVQVFDGNLGAVLQLKRVLLSKGLYNIDKNIIKPDISNVEYYFSKDDDEILDKCKNWLADQVSQEEKRYKNV
jgi:glutamate racemase